MPLYYFDVVDGNIDRDEIGVEFPNLDLARQDALRASGEMLRDISDEGHHTWKMIVRDECNVVVATIAFSLT